MSDKNREQKQYDHRLRELIQTTGDLDLATRHGVPRSTARGWLKQARTDVVSKGQTPDEMYFETGDDIPKQLAAAKLQARELRLKTNRERNCHVCVLPAPANCTVEIDVTQSCVRRISLRPRSTTDLLLARPRHIDRTVMPVCSAMWGSQISFTFCVEYSCRWHMVPATREPCEEVKGSTEAMVLRTRAEKSRCIRTSFMVFKPVQGCCSG
jgi:hypothetical protein